MYVFLILSVLIVSRTFRVGHRGGAGAAALQLPHGDAEKPRDSDPGGQEVHGDGERGRPADALPGRRPEARDDASVQLGPAAGSVRGSPQRHGEAPVLPRLWVLLQSREFRGAGRDWEDWEDWDHSLFVGGFCRGRSWSASRTSASPTASTRRAPRC